MKLLRLLGVRRILAPVCAAILAVGGIGVWALLRTSTPPTRASNHGRSPAVDGANGAVTGGTESTPSTVSDTPPTSDPTAEGEGPIPGLGAGGSNKVNPNRTLPASAQPADVLPEVPSLLLIPAVALVVFATAIIRNRRHQRRRRGFSGTVDGDT